MLSQRQRPRQMLRPMLIPGIHMAMVLGIDTDMVGMDIMGILHTDLTMVDMDTGVERRGKLSQQPQQMPKLMLSLGTLPMDMGVDTMDMVDTLPIGHTTDMVDIEGMGIMERSNLSTVSRSVFDNSPVTITNFSRSLVPLANMLLGLIFCVLGLLGLISFVCIFDNK